MNLVETIAIFIAGILFESMIDRFMLIAPGIQAGIDVVFVGIDEGARLHMVLNQWLNGLLLDVGQHFDDELAAALNHTEDGRFLRFEGAASALGLETIAPTGTSCGLDGGGLSFVTSHDIHLIKLDFACEWCRLALGVNGLPKEGGHFVYIILIQIQFLRNLLMRQVQTHEVKTQEP